MISPSQFRPLNNHCLIRRIDQSPSGIILLPKIGQRRNLMAALVACGPKFTAARPPETILAPWIFGTEEDCHFFPDGYHLIIPGRRICAVVVGEAHRRQIVPLGPYYLVRRLPHDWHKSHLIIEPRDDSQSLEFEVVRRGRLQDGEDFEQDIYPGTIGQVKEWSMDHIQIMTDAGECMIIPEADILFTAQ